MQGTFTEYFFELYFLPHFMHHSLMNSASSKAGLCFCTPIFLLYETHQRVLKYVWQVNLALKLNLDKIVSDNRLEDLITNYVR